MGGKGVVLAADLSTGRLYSEKLVSCVHRCILYQDVYVYAATGSSDSFKYD